MNRYEDLQAATFALTVSQPDEENQTPYYGTVASWREEVLLRAENLTKDRASMEAAIALWNRSDVSHWHVTAVVEDFITGLYLI